MAFSNWRVRAMIAPLTGIATGVFGRWFAMADIGGTSGSTTTISYGDIIINVQAGGEATGKEIGISITQALQRKGLL